MLVLGYIAIVYHTQIRQVLGQAFLNLVEPSCRPSVSDLLPEPRQPRVTGEAM